MAIHIVGFKSYYHAAKLNCLANSKLPSNAKQTHSPEHIVDVIEMLFMFRALDVFTNISRDGCKFSGLDGALTSTK